MIKQILTITGSLAAGALITYMATLGKVEEAESRGYLKGLSNGTEQSQVTSADFRTNVNSDVSLVLTRKDREKAVLVRNPNPAEYGALGEISKGLEGEFIELERARQIESQGLRTKFEGLVKQTLDDKAAQLQALKTARINEEVRITDKYQAMSGGYGATK